jgi:H+-transporting ATPase
MVTMAIGSKKMAEHKALVTHVSALQDIASMTVLNSDKTGTLTTARISIIRHRIYSHAGFTDDDVFRLAVVSANRDNKDDAIDGAICRSWDAEHGGTEDGGIAAEGDWGVSRMVGFNNAAKRTCCYATDPATGQSILIGKGLVTKILRCEPTAGQPDDEEDTHPQWSVEGCDTIYNEMLEKDAALATDGYKTIAICRQVLPDGPMDFVGILPMMDPVREDTAITIQRLSNCGISVKMITGDHLNIAKSTAIDCNLGTRIYPNTALWPAGHVRDKLIEEADGFAQVLPRDKRECVLALKNMGYICGMTGDGVNDAPALAEAQIGIAVEGSTDAAKNAADIQLLSSGLGAIYTAVVESRKIFRR